MRKRNALGPPILGQVTSLSDLPYYSIVYYPITFNLELTISQEIEQAKQTIKVIAWNAACKTILNPVLSRFEALGIPIDLAILYINQISYICHLEMYADLCQDKLTAAASPLADLVGTVPCTLELYLDDKEDVAVV